MSESSKLEQKTTNLNKERGRETSFTSSAAQRLPFFVSFFSLRQIRTIFLVQSRYSANTDITKTLPRG